MLIRPTYLVFVLSVVSVVVGVLNVLLFFYDLIPGQIPVGSPFYLRMAIVFVVGVPMVVQLVSHISPAQRPRAINVISLIAVLVFAIFLMSLLLPSMTRTIGTWGG
jgi:cytochrome c biogenesis factor